MNTTSTTLSSGLNALIASLQKEKENISNSYNSAIKNGEKYQSIKTLYLTLQDVDKKLRDLMRVNFTVVPQ